MPTLSIAARKEYYIELANALPPPVLDDLEYRERRRVTAVEAFDALRPGDSYEASLAVRIVLCGAHAVDGLREAGLYREDDAKRTRCRAQAASMMRAEDSAKRTLEREQKLRLAGEAVAGSTQAQPAVAGSVQPAAAGSVRPAVAVARPQPAEPQAPQPDRGAGAAPPPDQPTAAAAPSAPKPPAVALPRLAAVNSGLPPAPDGSVPPPSPEAIAQAEAFVNAHALAAAQIRHDRGVTPRNTAYFRAVTFPTDPAVIDALVRGRSGLLTLLDDTGVEALAEAA